MVPGGSRGGRAGAARGELPWRRGGGLRQGRGWRQGASFRWRVRRRRSARPVEPACRRLHSPLFFENPGEFCGADRRGAGVETGELGRAAARFPDFVFDAVGQGDEAAEEVSVLVEAVGRRRPVVDQVHQEVPALRFVDAAEELRQLRRRAGAGLGEVAGLDHDRVGGTQGRAGNFAGRAERLQRHGRGGGEGSQLTGGLGERGGGLAEVGEDRGGGVGEALQAAHREAELTQEGRELAQRGFQVGAAFGAGLGGGAGVGEEAGDVGAFVARAARGSSRSRRRAGSAGRAGR